MNEEQRKERIALEKQKLSELVAELERQKTTANKYDVVVPSDQLKMTYDVGTKTLKFEVPQLDGTPNKFHGINEHTHSQLANKLQIGKPYYDRMRAPDKLWLLRENVNAWLPEVNKEGESKKRLIRVLDDTVRAVLYDGYYILDNYDVFYSALNDLKEVSERKGFTIDIKQARLTEKRLYLKVTSPELTGFVKHYEDKKERVEAGIIISNSETGDGAFYVAPFVEVLVCKNGLIRQKKLRRVHLGKRRELGIVWDDETKKLTDKLTFSKMRDLIEKTFDFEVMKIWLDDMNKIASTEIEKPESAVDYLIKNTSITKDKKEELLNQFVREGSPTVWGLAMAVTRVAQEESSYDKQIEMETIGANLLEKKIKVQ